MERTDLLDTSIEAHKKRIALLREKGPDWRIEKMLELCEFGLSAFPEQTKHAIRKSMRARNDDSRAA